MFQYQNQSEEMNFYIQDQVTEVSLQERKENKNKNYSNSYTSNKVAETGQIEDGRSQYDHSIHFNIDEILSKSINTSKKNTCVAQNKSKVAIDWANKITANIRESERNIKVHSIYHNTSHESEINTNETDILKDDLTVISNPSLSPDADLILQFKSKLGFPVIDDLKIKLQVPTNAIPAYSDLIVSIKRVYWTGLFMEWLLLKSKLHQTEIETLSSTLQIYSTTDIKAIKSYVSLKSALPLPLLTYKHDTTARLYIIDTIGHFTSEKHDTYSNFPNSKDKDLPLNVLDDCITFGRNLMNSELCKEPIGRIIIKIRKTGVLTETQILHFKSIILKKHVKWGFLQIWIVNLQKNSCRDFKLQTIAENLELKQASLSEMTLLEPAVKENIYIIFGKKNMYFYIYFDKKCSDIVDADISYITFTALEIDLKTDISLISYNHFYINHLDKIKAQTEKSSQLRTKTVEEINSLSIHANEIIGGVNLPSSDCSSMLLTNSGVEGLQLLPQIPTIAAKISGVQTEPCKNKATILSTSNASTGTTLKTSVPVPLDLISMVIKYIESCLRECFKVYANSNENDMNIDLSSLKSSDKSYLSVQVFQESVIAALNSNNKDTFYNFLSKVYLKLRENYVPDVIKEIMNIHILKKVLQLSLDAPNVFLSVSNVDLATSQGLLQKVLLNEGVTDASIKDYKGEPLPKIPKLLLLSDLETKDLTTPLLKKYCKHLNDIDSTNTQEECSGKNVKPEEVRSTPILREENGSLLTNFSRIKQCFVALNRLEVNQYYRKLKFKSKRNTEIDVHKKRKKNVSSFLKKLNNDRLRLDLQFQNTIQDGVQDVRSTLERIECKNNKIVSLKNNDKTAVELINNSMYALEKSREDSFLYIYNSLHKDDTYCKFLQNNDMSRISLTQFEKNSDLNPIKNFIQNPVFNFSHMKSDTKTYESVKQNLSLQHIESEKISQFSNINQGDVSCNELEKSSFCLNNKSYTVGQDIFKNTQFYEETLNSLKKKSDVSSSFSQSTQVLKTKTIKQEGLTSDSFSLFQNKNDNKNKNTEILQSSFSGKGIISDLTLENFNILESLGSKNDNQIIDLKDDSISCGKTKILDGLDSHCELNCNEDIPPSQESVNVDEHGIVFVDVGSNIDLDMFESENENKISSLDQSLEKATINKSGDYYIASKNENGSGKNEVADQYVRKENINVKKPEIVELSILSCIPESENTQFKTSINDQNLDLPITHFAKGNVGKSKTLLETETFSNMPLIVKNERRALQKNKVLNDKELGQIVIDDDDDDIQMISSNLIESSKYNNISSISTNVTSSVGSGTEPDVDNGDDVIIVDDNGGNYNIERLNLKHQTHFNFECIICKAKFYTKVKYSAHWLKKHKEVKTFYCNFCGKSFFTEEFLKVHIEKSRHLYCEICEIQLPTVETINNHFLSARHIQNKRWKEGGIINR